MMMRWRHLGLVLPFLVLPAQAPCAEYVLGPEDNLSVRVYEWPDLSGDFKVGADGRISVPLIGSVAAAGQTVDQLEKTIQATLAQEAGLKDTPSVAVQVKDYRPFFITGDVQKPGAYAFRPGLTILQAVSLAGGYFRFADPGLLRLERDAIIQRGERRVLNEQLAALIARKSRLKAERDGAADIAFPSEEGFDQKRPEIAALMEQERLVFRTRRDDLNRELSGLTDLQDLYRGEIQALQSQIEAEKHQGDLVQTELDQLHSLAERGLTSNPRLLLVERTLAEIEASKRNIQALIMRSRQSIAQAAQQADVLKAKFREHVDEENDQVTSKIRETRSRLDTATRLVSEAEDTAPTTIAQRLRNIGASPEFTVSRKRSNATTDELQAAASDEVEPGDVIVVKTSAEGTTEIGTKQSAVQTGPTAMSEMR
jgi:protein involved in polysaccharide export with SLBB domain